MTYTEKYIKHTRGQLSVLHKAISDNTCEFTLRIDNDNCPADKHKIAMLNKYADRITCMN